MGSSDASVDPGMPGQALRSTLTHCNLIGLRLFLHLSNTRQAICNAGRSVDWKGSARGYCGQVFGGRQMIRPSSPALYLMLSVSRRPAVFSGKRLHETIVGETTS